MFLRLQILMLVLVSLTFVCKTQSMGGEKKTTKKSKVATSDELLEQIEAKYGTAKTVQMNLEKQLVLSMLNKSTKQKGVLKSQGAEKLKIEFKSPTKTIFILNEKSAWVAEYPEAGSKDKVRVIKYRLGKKSHAQIFIGTILGKGKILTHFQIKDKKQSDKSTEYALVPKTGTEDITKLSLIVDNNDKLIKELKYWDALDNETRLIFTSVVFDNEFSDKEFDYTPPKGAEIISEG